MKQLIVNIKAITILKYNLNMNKVLCSILLIILPTANLFADPPLGPSIELLVYIFLSLLFIITIIILFVINLKKVKKGSILFKVFSVLLLMMNLISILNYFKEDFGDNLINLIPYFSFLQFGLFAVHLAFTNASHNFEIKEYIKRLLVTTLLGGLQILIALTIVYMAFDLFHSNHSNLAYGHNLTNGLYIPNKNIALFILVLIIFNFFWLLLTNKFRKGMLLAGAIFFIIFFNAKNILCVNCFYLTIVVVLPILILFPIASKYIKT